MTAVQYFSDEYLDQCKSMSTDQVLRFLEDFRSLHAVKPAATKLISIKIPEDLLNAFKVRARLAGTPYQTQIKVLMKAWVQDQQIGHAQHDET